MDNKSRVFLSYGHDGISQEIVERLRSDLIGNGYEVWWDQSGIKGGDDWRREITEGLKASTHVLALLSKYSTRKPGVCRQEIAIALGPAKAHVYTVLVEPECDVTPPLLVSHKQWMDMQEWTSRKADGFDEFEKWYQEKLDEILRVLELNEPFAGEIAELEQWLRPMDCTADMVQYEHGFIGRNWLIGNIAQSGEHFDDEPGGELEFWRTSGLQQRVFWLVGDPGSGKSAVAARLAHSGRVRVIAVHFCRYDRPERRDACRTVRSIAYQMATRLGDYRALLVAQARKGIDLEDKNPQELFDHLLANPLRYELGGGAWRS